MFANHIRARMAPTEFGLIFGYTDEAPTGGKFSEEFVQIIMTWPVLKTLMLSLQSAVAVYEETNGEILMSGPKPVPQDKMLSAMADIKAQAAAERAKRDTQPPS